MRPTGKACLAGVVGWPISHSKSPALHGWWLDQLGIDGAYVPLPVEPENIVAAIRLLPKIGFKGVNVTVPHKQAVLAALDSVDRVARRIGAVNTILVQADGSITGTNTDAYGFLAHLRDTTPNYDLTSGPVAVLGSGGAARAVVAALVDAGAPELRLVCRSRENGQELAAAIGGPISLVPWQEAEEALRGAALLVNATSLGLHGQAPLDLALDALPRDAVVDDIVYVPLETDLLRRARLRGNRVVDGLGMLIHQARPAFQAFFGQMPDSSPELRAFLLSP